jgi:hypothetical protein
MMSAVEFEGEVAMGVSFRRRHVSSTDDTESSTMPLDN